MEVAPLVLLWQNAIVAHLRTSFCVGVISGEQREVLGPVAVERGRRQRANELLGY